MPTHSQTIKRGKKMNNGIKWSQQKNTSTHKYFIGIKIFNAKEKMITKLVQKKVYKQVIFNS